MSAPDGYWFLAKRFGWGWVPCAWQGWVVLAVFLVLVAAGSLFVLPAQGGLFFAGYVLVLCVLLAAVCWAKGEPPRWRWGK